MRCVLVVSWNAAHAKGAPGGQAGALGKRGKGRAAHVVRARLCATMVAVLRRPGGFERSEKPMDTQTIIAVCAVFTVVIGIVSLARRE